MIGVVVPQVDEYKRLSFSPLVPFSFSNGVDEIGREWEFVHLQPRESSVQTETTAAALHLFSGAVLQEKPRRCPHPVRCMCRERKSRLQRAVK